MLVNKQELADILGISLPTLDDWIKRDAGFPVEQRGARGVEWQFSADAVLAFRKAQQIAENEAAEARRAQLDMYRLPLTGGGGAEAAAGFTPQQELALARKRQIEMDQAKAAGFLVETSQVRLKLGHAVELLNKSLQSFPAQIGRRFALPETTVLAMRDTVEDFQRELVRNLRDLSEPEPASDGGP